MYLDLFEEDPEKNRRRNTMIFIVCVLLLASIIKCAGQNCLIREDITKKVKRISTCNSLMFFVDAKQGTDTIFLGLYADSVGINAYYFSVYVHFPKGLNIKSSRLDIGFNKEGIESIEPSFIKEDYVEYMIINKEQHYKLKNLQYEYINFYINDFDVPFVGGKGDFFNRFFKAI